MLFESGRTHSILLLLSLVVVLGCKKEQVAVQREVPPAPVGVMTVTPTTRPIVYSEIGQTAASRKVEIRARIKGYIAKRHFEEGKRAEEGDVLYEIDAREFQVALQQAEAQLLRSQANLDLADRDIGRLTPLVEQQSISPKELDDALTRQKVGRGDVAASQADVEQANLRLSYTKITTPVSGIIGLTLKQEGSFVDDLNNSLLTTALQTDPMYVNFAVPERSMLRYTDDVRSGRVVIPSDNGWRVLVELADGSTYEIPGTLDMVGFEVNPATGTAQFRASIPNPDGKLIDGQFVKVRLLGATRPGAIVVPQKAVQMGEQGPFVYVVTPENTAEIRPVKTGSWIPPEWFVEDGLKPGDTLIVDGIQKLQPGAKVAPHPYIATTQPATRAAATAPPTR